MQNWQLKTTSNINQMLRVKQEINPIDKISNLVIVKHHFHIADDIMFPDPACLAFFTSFEQNHLQALEEEKRLLLVAIDIFEGEMKFYIYCEDTQKCIYDCISYLKSNSLYQVSFEIYNQDEFKTYNKLLAI